VRYQHASEMHAELRLKCDTKSGPSSIGAGHVTSRISASTEPRITGHSLRVLRREHWPLVLAGLLTLIASSGMVWFATHRGPPARPEPKARRLTANPAGNPATDAHISPDGKYLAYADLAGIHLQVTATGETRTIPQPRGLEYEVTGWSPVGWFPDGTKLLAQVTSPTADHSGMWVISMLGGPPREIYEGGLGWGVSPNGSLIAFTSSIYASDIWLIAANGEEPRKIVTAGEGESLFWVVWSPDSRRLAYERRRWSPAGFQFSIETRDITGGQASVVLSDPNLGSGRGLWWLPDRRVIYSSGDGAWSFGPAHMNLWEIEVDTESGQPVGKAERIINWTDFSFAGPNATADGKRLVFGRVNSEADVYVGDLEKGGKHLTTPAPINA
jgi:hypothetical protein